MLVAFAFWLIWDADLLSGLDWSTEYHNFTNAVWLGGEHFRNF